MNRGSLKALIALNVALLVALAVLTFSPQPAAAQQLGRAAGNFIMIAGQIEGREGQQAGIYILDIANGQMVWIIYNSSTKRVEPIARRDVAQDLQVGQRR